MKHALVIGAGFAGAVTARTLAGTGEWQVMVIDKRDHIAGNAYDFVNEVGIRVHKYGPHLWHTSNDKVQEWASRFTEWLPYKHKVKAQLGDGSFVPLPINPETIEKVFGHRFHQWVIDNGWADSAYYGGGRLGSHAAFLETLVEHHPEVTNSRQHIENSVGKELCDLFFAPYTAKMWGLELEELPSSVAARIPTNVESGSDLYFPKDTHQCLPKDGYTVMFERIFDHPNITVETNVDRKTYMSMVCDVLPGRAVFDHIFTSEPIDTAYDECFGALPWRSVKMDTVTLPLVNVLPTATVNFTHDAECTRVTEWKKLPGHGANDAFTTLTFEKPCDYSENHMERYYPVKTSQADCPNIALYKKYKGWAEKDPTVTFIGRCGMYVYQDMHAVISTTLAIVNKFLETQDAQV